MESSISRLFRRLSKKVFFCNRICDRRVIPYEGSGKGPPPPITNRILQNDETEFESLPLWEGLQFHLKKKLNNVDIADIFSKMFVERVVFQTHEMLFTLYEQSIHELSTNRTALSGNQAK